MNTVSLQALKEGCLFLPRICNLYIQEVLEVAQHSSGHKNALRMGYHIYQSQPNHMVELVTLQ